MDQDDFISIEPQRSCGIVSKDFYNFKYDETDIEEEKVDYRPQTLETLHFIAD